MSISAGPGAYDAEGWHGVGKGPAFSMSSRPSSAPSHRTPGPGAYQLSQISYCIRQFLL